MTLFRARVDKVRIMAIGRWHSDTFLNYLRPNATNWSSDLSGLMVAASNQGNDKNPIPPIIVDDDNKQHQSSSVFPTVTSTQHNHRDQSSNIFMTTKFNASSDTFSATGDDDERFRHRDDPLLRHNRNSSIAYRQYFTHLLPTYAAVLITTKPSYVMITTPPHI
jgi:hypothetical protein